MISIRHFSGPGATLYGINRPCSANFHTPQPGANSEPQHHPHAHPSQSGSRFCANPVPPHIFCKFDPVVSVPADGPAVPEAGFKPLKPGGLIQTQRCQVTGLVLIFVFAVVPMEPGSILNALLQLNRFLLMAMFLGVVHAIGFMAIETVFIAKYNWPQ